MGAECSTETSASPTAAEDFEAAEAFAGARAGWAFRAGDRGTGYYRDEPPEITVTAEILEAEKAERLAKVKAFKSQAAQLVHERTLECVRVARRCADSDTEFALHGGPAVGLHVPDR